MTLTSKPLAIIVVLILFGGIFSSSLLGWWQTESSKEAAVYTEGEFAGQANPADIRGSYTFGDVENNFAVPASLLAQAFGVENGDPAAFPVKELEAQYADSPVEIGTASVRLFVAFYLGLPFDLSTDIYLPQPAADILQTRSLTAEQSAYLSSHTAGNAGAIPAAPAPVETQAPAAGTTQAATVESSDTTVKGKTTFANLLSWGLPVEKIEAILDMPMPEDKTTTIKNFCSANGLDFETIKAELQEAVDQAKK